jgi:signal-transduction protein with cAMP-binding, CBS, and nucleotidyltransferase domain
LNPGPPVGEICSSSYLTVPQRRRVVEVARWMGERWASAVIVVEQGRPVGIITRHTLIKDVLARGFTGMELTAGEIMHAPILTVDEKMVVQEAAALMALRGVRHLAVVRGETLVGLLSDYQVARLLHDLIAGFDH